MAACCVGDPDQSAHGVEQINILALLQCQILRIVQHICAVHILIEVVALGIAVAVHLFITLLEVDLFSVLTDIDVAGIKNTFVLEGCRHHALHQVKLEAVANLHRREVCRRKLDPAVRRILVSTQRTVV